MACKCDFFVPNETELAILTGMPVKTEAEIQQAANVLLEQGLKNVIVTMGQRGAMWLTKEQTECIPAYKVNAVDTTGAGDAFIGCFADNYVKTKDVMESIRKASAFSALSVMKRGTQISYPTCQELEEFWERHQ